MKKLIKILGWLMVLALLVGTVGCKSIGGKDTPKIEDIDLSKAVWYGVDGHKAKTTETLDNLTFDGKKIYYSISAGTDLWLPRNVKEKNCNQYSCFFVLRNGVYMGGKFDWSTYSRKDRPVTHIRSGYAGGIKPKKGETVWICFTDLNGTKRTNCKSFVWK